jgi:hypothetical protein
MSMPSNGWRGDRDKMFPRTHHIKLVIISLFLCGALALGEDIHVIQVVDSSTGRGVPCVQLETVNHIRLLTDSNGIAVFDEPGLMNTKVFFTITSDGYEYPKDGFGYAGVAIDTTPNAKTVIKIRRINIAERLYRITGQGIYDQTVRAGKLAGVSIPISHPVLNGGVLGQDTVETIIYHGKIFWFWGDTNVAKYPLGNFRTTGATSELPGQGGLDPSIGVDLKYFTTSDGLPREMVAGLPADGPVWVDGLMIVRDASGVERLICKYVRIKSLVVRYATGLLEWNDKAEQFQPLIDFAKDERLAPECQPIRIHETGGDYFYFPSPYAILRVRADWNSIQNPHDYESFTCLRPGTRYAAAKSAALDRDASGQLIWAWKADTGAVDQAAQKELLAAHKIKSAEVWFNLYDEHGKPVTLAAGTVCWNNFLKKWILIAHESLGHPSRLGEVWLTTSDHPWGPFRKGVKIATHEIYTFYNVVQHPQFDQAGGRIVYFEGTYTNSFSYSDQTTPRYDYNQMMYRVDLGDPRLKWAEN